MPLLEPASWIRPCPGHEVAGDAVVIEPVEGGLFAAIVDVLGHGPEAHQLALRIEAYLARYASTDVGGLMSRLHRHLQGTRGAAVGLCAIEEDSGRVGYAGTGNTVLRRIGRTETRLVSQEGVLGQNMRTPREQTLALEKGDLILLYTDGVQDRFGSEDYPSLLHHAPKDVVRTIIDRFGKHYDDAACIAVRFDS